MKSRQNKFYFVMLFFLFSLALIVYAIQTAEIEINDVTEFRNTTNVPVPVILDNNVSVAGFQFNINHTSNLVFNGVQVSSRMPNATIETKDESGKLKIAALIKEDIAAGNGVIMNITFDIPASADAGDFPLNATEVIVADIDTQTFSTSLIQGTFTILIDTDGDGIDDSTDVCPNTFGCVEHSGCSFGLDEWLPPIKNLSEFDLQQGATLPFKFSATNCSDDFYEDEGILVRIFNTTLSIDKTYNASGEGSDYVRINITEEQYITNINTNGLGMPLGNYTIFANFSNNLSPEIGFELIQNGKGKGRNH